MDDRLPGLVIGGAPRSGTTHLAALYDQHPDIFVAKPFIPEPKVCMTTAPDGPAGYVRRYHALFRDAPAGKLLVEKTSYYLENDEALARLRAVVPARTRFIFILREPVERAYSNYLWSRQNGLETLPFGEAVRLDPKLRPSPLKADRAYARPFDYLARNDYGRFAESWFAAFGRERVRFVLLEQLKASRRTILKEIQEFAGVEPLDAEHFGMAGLNPSDPAGLSLDPALRDELRQEMWPLVDRLAAVTGLDVGLWGY
jgi:sulfotransferase family protein